MKTIDVRGKLCPEPLIITKRAIKTAGEETQFVVLLDNEVATCNLEQLLREMKINFTTKREGESASILFTLDGSEITSVKAEDYCTVPEGVAAPTSSYVVVLSSDSMGANEELGRILVRGFINSLAEQDRLPKTIVLYNSGVLVAKNGADTTASLKSMSEQGVDIILCGVCVDFFAMKEEIGVGRISNMMEITKVTTEAAHIVYP